MLKVDKIIGNVVKGWQSNDENKVVVTLPQLYILPRAPNRHRFGFTILLPSDRKLSEEHLKGRGRGSGFNCDNCVLP